MFRILSHQWLKVGRRKRMKGVFYSEGNGVSAGRYGLISFLLVILCVFFSYSLACGQQLGFQIRDNGKVAEIPFEKVNNLIVVPVLLNNLIPLNFMLDTGVKTAILTDRFYSDLLQLPYSRKISLKGAGYLQQVNAYVTSNISFVLPEVTGHGQSMLVLEEDYLQLAGQLGVEVQGILGYELFRRYVVKIDYQKSVLTLYEPHSFKPRRNYTAFHMEIVDTKPYIRCVLAATREGKKKGVNLFLDTGASHSLLLHQKRDSAERFQLPEEVLYGMLGRGLVGDIYGYMGRVHGLGMQDFIFENVLVSFPNDTSYVITDESFRDGTIGGELLKRFTVIFDYPNGRLYLKRNRNYRDEFVFSKTGMELVAEGPDLNQFRVIMVREDSPAAEAGIKAGDELLKINFSKTNIMNLMEINERFRKREGRKVRLHLKRGDEVYKTVLRLRNII